MRIGIDVSSALDPRPSGVARYIRCLIHALDEVVPTHEVCLFHRPSRARVVPPETLFPQRSSPLFRWKSPIGCDVFHAPDGRLPGRLKLPAVVTLHDLSAWERDDHASRRFLARKQRFQQDAVTRASVIVTHSETVASAIRARFPDMTAEVRAIPLAPGDGQAALSVDPAELSGTLANRSGGPLLLVGGPSLRKNSGDLLGLLQAWETAGWAPEVVWVGSTPLDEARSFLAGWPEAVRARIDLQGHVPDDELRKLYLRSAALVALSTTEGFGMPLLEAAQLGCPVIARECAVSREVLGDGGAHWLPATDASERCREIGRLFGGGAQDASEVPTSIQDRCAAALETASAYTWNRTARRMAEVYELAFSASQRRG